MRARLDSAAEVGQHPLGDEQGLAIAAGRSVDSIVQGAGVLVHEQFQSVGGQRKGREEGYARAYNCERGAWMAPGGHQKIHGDMVREPSLAGHQADPVPAVRLVRMGT